MYYLSFSGSYQRSTGWWQNSQLVTLTNSLGVIYHCELHVLPILCTPSNIILNGMTLYVQYNHHTHVNNTVDQDIFTGKILNFRIV